MRARNVKVGAALEILIDKYVLIAKDGYDRYHYIEDSSILRKKYQPECEFDLYGAMWTEEGLIFIAKAVKGKMRINYKNLMKGEEIRK